MNRRQVFTSIMPALTAIFLLKAFRIPRTTNWSSPTLECTGIAFNGGGLGGPLQVIITLASSDGSTQVVITKDSAEPFVDHNNYQIVASSV